jgi:hypothetical protein
MNNTIDIFSIHEKIMHDYKHFVKSFIHIKDENMNKIVEAEIDKGKFWPEPLIQFNPSYEPGDFLFLIQNRTFRNHSCRSSNT